MYARSHVRQPRALIGNVVDIEKNGARQVPLFELFTGVAVATQVPGGIHASNRVGERLESVGQLLMSVTAGCA